MCFSPQASFLAGITLTMIGLASMKKAYQAKRRDLLPLAATPLLFGVQQLLEGALWLGLLATPRQEILYSIGLYGFIFFAFFWWPWWIPYTVARCEQKAIIKRIAYFFSLAGFVLGVYLLWHPFTAEILNGHIAYNSTITSYIPFFLYLFISLTPCFFSSTPLMWMTGLLTLVGLVASIFAYFTWFASVWCFFGALTSASIYAIIRRIAAQ